MEWLNYHHLLYFWLITREGGLAKAAARLRLSHSTLSVQLRALEGALGAELFERRGRRLVLTPFGSEVAAYASDIFRLGAELLDVARGRSAPRGTPFRVGVVAALPKTVTYRLVEPGLRALDTGPVQVRQGDLTRLLEELATNRLHLVLSDAPPPQGLPLRLHAHALGDTEILLYGSRPLATRFRRRFPRSLDGAPLLLPTADASLRRLLERWLADRGIRARIAGEFDDAGLLRVFGAFGLGLFPVRAALRTEVEEGLGAVCVGALDGLRERYYAISLERRVRHLGVSAIIDAARAQLSPASGRALEPRSRPRPERSP